MSQELFQQATAKLAEVEQVVFFAKICQYGIQAKTDEQARYLLSRADSLLEQFPFDGSESQGIKSASLQQLGSPERKLASDGFSEEAHAYVDALMQDPSVVSAVKIALTAQVV